MATAVKTISYKLIPRTKLANETQAAFLARPYRASVQARTSWTFQQFCAEVERVQGTKESAMLAALTSMKKELAELLSNGDRVDIGFGSMFLGITGSVSSERKLDSANDICLMVSPASDVKAIGNESTVCSEILAVPTISCVEDATTLKENVIDAAHQIGIHGLHLGFSDIEPDEGVFILVGDVPTKLLTVNNSSKTVYATIPESVAAGKYRLYVSSRIGKSKEDISVPLKSASVEVSITRS